MHPSLQKAAANSRVGRSLNVLDGSIYCCRFFSTSRGKTHLTVIMTSSSSSKPILLAGSQAKQIYLF